jgi:NAD(P)-dependent dehydrogenase (short-subunit alcohol dehydrogenase family)
MHNFNEKKIIVTGAASGIGFAVSKLFSQSGAKVYGIDKSDCILDWNLSVIKGSLFKGDVSKEDTWIEVLSEVGPKLDILVNVAGINENNLNYSNQDTPDNIDISAWREIHKVNIESVVIGCNHTIPLMKKYGGSIVNVSSIAALKAWPQKSAYGASKAALLQYTKSIALYCAKSNLSIRCNAVLPGPIDTPMISRNSNFIGGDGKIGVDHIPMRRLGLPEEVARPILFLASERSSYITGIGLCIDGGISSS